MTILTAKLTERKDDIPPPEVISDYALLIQNDKNETAVLGQKVPVFPTQQSLEGGLHSGAAPMPVFLQQRRRRSLWLLLICLGLLVVLLLGSICLYKRMAEEREKREFFCGVRYHDDAQAFMERMLGEFEQNIEIDDAGFEKIMVPTIGDTRRATILHDFNINYTAIIDKEQGHCFLMPLNRSLVLPPKDFWDLLVKLNNGYYVPHTNIVREDYRVLTPQITDFTEYGTQIAGECRVYDTYKLAREGEPIAMAKRSVCEFAGERYCLGDGGVDL